MKNLTRAVLALFVLTTSFASFADKMDSETQNLVIEKLDRVLSLMEPKEKARIPTETRLADLLAERARLRYMNEMDKNCKNCPGSKDDRVRATALYEKVLGATEKSERGRILFQLAHLYIMAGKNDKAISLFKQILSAPKNQYAKDLVGLANSALADLYFETEKFKDALNLYKNAFNIPETPGRGLILYRIAWCQLNLEQLRAGTNTLEKLLNSPDLLQKVADKDNVGVDEGFRNDVLHDLATFYAKQRITEKEITHIDELTPKEHRKEMLLFFAGEADRLGQKKAAGQIYATYLKDETLTKEERLDAYVHLAQTNYDGGNSSRSIEEFAVAAAAYKKVKCSEDAKCMDLQKRMRYFVTELHRSKKTKPDEEVLKAYVSYVQAFPEDAEMAILGAQVAMDLKKYQTACDLYDRAGDTKSKFQEQALAGEIEAAETSGDLNLKRTAYNHYLAVDANGPKAFEVRYQLAQVSYDEKNWQKAADEFRVLALNKKGAMELRKKSADLSLDALALLKKDDDIESLALEFAAAMPAYKLEFHKIARKAFMNQIAGVTNDAKSSNSDLRRALVKMQRVPLAGATDQEKILHLKNQMVLADKVNDETVLLLSIRELVSIKTLSNEDREAALSRAVAVYERRLDFTKAYETARLMKFPGKTASDREFRLGTLADLSGRYAAGPHYLNALHAGLAGEAALTVRTRLVYLSRNPYQELRNQAPYLSSNVKNFSDLILQIYAKNPQQKRLLDFFRDARLANTTAGVFIRKQPLYAQNLDLIRKFHKQRISARTDAQLKNTIAERVKLLKAADDELSQALAFKDFTSQMMVLGTIKVENERTANEILSLPLPRGLRPDEKSQYTLLLNQKTAPFLSKAGLAQQKIQELWNNPAPYRAIIQTYQNSRNELKPFWAREIRLLSEVAPNTTIQNELNSTIHQKVLTIADLQAARLAVRENPDDVRDIENLKTMETKIGHPLASAYLNSRLEQIQREKKL